ncbi:hypothetical protein CBR_g37787 [Chara braunii]|uniref:RNA-directed DNA polymerase n=1 Tax=Chara braunii TaxID=69332 RepID=A0A388LNI9_CHABU|nr:hypothetical protein CBR_g37787 [Chara braunii]|eukprot:GBG83916.1 hypothetical protein CBR_g37787 [Chara braunii]
MSDEEDIGEDDRRILRSARGPRAHVSLGPEGDRILFRRLRERQQEQRRARAAEASRTLVSEAGATAAMATAAMVTSAQQTSQAGSSGAVGSTVAQTVSQSTGIMASQAAVLTPEDVAIQQAALQEAQLQWALGEIKAEKEKMIRRRVRMQRRGADIEELELMDLTHMDADVKVVRRALLGVIEMQKHQTTILQDIQQSLAVLAGHAQATPSPAGPGAWPVSYPPFSVPPVTGVYPYVAPSTVAIVSLGMPLSGGVTTGSSLQVPVQTVFTPSPSQVAVTTQPDVSQPVQPQGTQPQQLAQQPVSPGPQPGVTQGPGQTQWVPKTAIAAPKPFTGDKRGEDLDTWLRAVSVYVRCKLTLPHEEVFVAASYLEGSAARWLSGLVQLQGYGHDFRAWAASQKLEDFLKMVEERWHDPQEAQRTTDAILTLHTRQFKSVREATDAVERLICVPGVRYDPQVLLTSYLRCFSQPLRNQFAKEADINMHNFPSFSKVALDLEAKIGHGKAPTTDGRKKTLPPNWKAKGRIMFVDNDGSTIELDGNFQEGVGSEAGSVEASEGGVVAVVSQKDASQYGIGTVLAQQEGPKLRPVEYMSKKMPSQKLAKSTYEKELYAVYKALTHWRHYLLGRLFILRTDHQTLRWMRTQPVLSDTLKRWIEVIEQYDFDPQYLKGQYNKVADALSRRPDFSGALITEFDLTDNVTRSLVDAYREDQFMSEIIRRLQAKGKKTSAEFELVNGLLFVDKDGNKRLCVPSRESLRSLFLGECHDATGHFGYKKTAANLLQRFWWPTMMRDAQLYVETCQVCQRDKPRTQAPLGLLKPLPIPERPGTAQSPAMAPGKFVACSARSAVPRQQCHVQSQCHVSSATSAVPRKQQCHVNNATVPRQQCPATMTGAALGMPGQLANESLADYNQRFQTQLALIEAEEQRQLAAKAARLQAEAAATTEKQRLQAEADADTEARHKEALHLLRRHEATSIERLKFWHFEPSEGHGDATPEEQHREFMAKLVTRLVYTSLPPSTAGESTSWSRLEELDPLTFADFQWMPLPRSGRLPKPRCNVLMAQLRDYLHTAVPTPLMDAGVEVVDLHAYIAKIDREFKMQRYDDIDAPLLYVRIQIGEATCSALIDCGASRNSMSQDLMVRAGLGPHVWRKSQPTQVTLADGHTHKSIDQCIDDVPVYFAPHASEAVSFDILDTKFDMILSMSWLRSEDHPVNFYRRTVDVRDRNGVLVPCTVAPPHPSISYHVVSAASMRASIIRDDIEEMEMCFLHALPPHDASSTDSSSDPRITELLDAYSDVLEVPHGVVPDRPIRHEIILEDGAVPPRSCIYRMSEEELSVLRAQLDDLLEKGWIRPTSLPNGAPVLFVRKKNKDLRLWIDYRKLNAQTIINIRKEDHYKTAFKTRYGHFEWLVMPFALTNAPATFQAAMTTEFRHMLDRFVLIYLDDILVYNRSLDDNVEHLRTVLERLRQAKYKANRDKCEFTWQKLEYLGHYVTPHGIRSLADKIKALHVWPEPTNTTNVRSFMGLAGHYERFITGYSRSAAPMTRLQSPKVPFVFDDDARRSFQALKTAMLMAPVLSIYDPTLPTRVTTDASGYGIGAVLEQHDGDDWHLVNEVWSDASRTFLGASTTPRPDPPPPEPSVPTPSPTITVTSPRQFAHFIRQDDITFFTVNGTDLLHYDPPCPDAELISLEPDPPSISMPPISASLPPLSVESTPSSLADIDAKELARYTADLEPAVRDLIREYHDIFPSPFSYAGIPPMRDVEHAIQLVRNYRVHHQTPYRLSIPEATELKRQLEELLRLGSIKPSNSPWGAPVLFARKADETLRLCIDYHGLNRYTVKNNYPMPRSDELFNRLAGAIRLDLSEFSFTTEHIKGETNRVADALSRHPNHDQQQIQLAAISVTTVHPLVTDEFRTHYRHCPDYRDIHATLRSGKTIPNYYLGDNGLVYWYGSQGIREPPICVPSTRQLRVQAVTEFHDQAAAGHMGFHKMLARVSRLFVWPKRKDFVKDYVAECPICQEVNNASYLPYGLLQPRSIPEGRWQSMSIDFIGPLRPPTPRSHDVILVLVDCFTKRARFVLCRYAIGAREVAGIEFDRVTRDHGLPP